MQGPEDHAATFRPVSADQPRPHGHERHARPAADIAANADRTAGIATEALDVQAKKEALIAAAVR